MTKYGAFLLEPPSPLAIVMADKITSLSDDFHHSISGYDDPVTPLGQLLAWVLLIKALNQLNEFEELPLLTWLTWTEMV